MRTQTLRRLRIVLALASGLAAAPALAQDEAPTVEPPRLVTFIPAEYPAEALAAGEGARVPLLLVVGVDGRVVEAEVVSPVGGGFDEAALAAARRFVFEPARRNGEPIAAKIRYDFVFEPPAPPAPEPAPAPPPGALGGVVLEQTSGMPVEAADVEIADDQGGPVARLLTDEAGRFACDGLVAGRYRVRVSAYGLVGVDRLEEVGAGELTELTYRLAPRTPRGEDDGFGATAVVEAPAREVTRRRIAGDDLTKVPGTRGDALRVVELLPGVARPPAGSSMLLVRGSSPFDSGAFLDGVEVPYLYHVGGLASFTSPNLIRSIDLYPGNFSARYGRWTGGVVEVGLRDPRADRGHGVVDVNLIDASLLVEGPIAGPWSFAAAARRSYVDFWFAEVVPSEEIGVESAPVYWDYQSIVVYRPTSDDQLRLQVYGASDEMAIVLKKPADSDPRIRGELSAATAFHKSQLRWHHRYGDALEHDVSLTAGVFTTNFDLGPELHQVIDGKGLWGRAEWRARLAPRVRLTAGVDVNEEHAGFEYRGTPLGQLEGSPDHGGGARPPTELDLAVNYFRPAAYVEASVSPVDGVEVIGGARTDYFGDTDQLLVDPRLVVRYQPLPETTVKLGAGRFSQPPFYPQTMEGIGTPGIRATRAWHFGGGVEQLLGDASVGLEGFYKDLDDLILDAPGGGLTNGGDGRIYGLEVSAKVPPGRRFSGFLSYTLSRSERRDGGATWRLFDYDQTHILSAAGSARLGRGFSFGATLRLTSGSPRTPITGSVYDANRDVYLPMFGAVNSERAPGFFQLDVRVEKQWRVGGRSVAAYLDLQNATNARHVEGEHYSYDYREKTPSYGLPILPSLGVRGEL